MEFAVAILSAAVSAAVSSAVPKLGRVIDKLAGKPKTDAQGIKHELQLIQYIIRKNSSVGCPLLCGLVCDILRELSYEIEDCLDCFEVKKTSPEEFAKQLAELQTKSKEAHEQIATSMKLNEDMEKSAATSSAHGQWQQLIAQAAAFEVVLVPHELQVLLGKQDWLDNLNRLLYFCMFPHDHDARRNPLIRRWLAEGLVRGEDDAVKYLKALINGKIINTTVKSNNGMMKRCQPPDDILSFIYKQSSSTSFMLFCDDMDKLKADCVRRLSLHPNKETLDDKNLPDFPHLHTLAVFQGRYEAILRFRKYKVLRVLDLKGCAPLYTQQILAICKLLLLKYLSFRCGTHQLPSEIGKLAWLETLDMRESNTVITVSKEVLKMPNLKHLLGMFRLAAREPSGAVLFGWQTTKLATFLERKSSLQTLSGFVIDNWRGFPQLMILMRTLKKVKIWCKPNASAANLRDISSAITESLRDGMHDSSRSLSIDFQECSGKFLNNLDEVQGGLTSLKLYGNLSKFPQFVAQLLAIEELCLSSTSLTWDVILAGLSSFKAFKYLKLVEDNLGLVEILPEHLRSLESLCLVCASNLDITIQVGALPGLVSLHLICQNLEVLPGSPGMEIIHMTNLQEVGLHSEVGPPMKQGWEIGAEVHPNKPRVFDVSP